MELSAEIKKYLDSSVLCWLATVSKDRQPNVSPKECFTYFGNNSIIIANIASPQTVQNIRFNNKVCISFIDVFIQKGFQLKGKGIIIDENNPEFEQMASMLNEITKGKFPFNTITKIIVEHAKPIIAPSYILFPETTENDQIENSKKTYGM